MSGLSKSEILKIVNRYIGVKSGYLGDFSYKTHFEFYPEYCDLDIDPDEIEGTTRERFIQIIEMSNPSDQAKILRGVLERFPVDAKNSISTRTETLKKNLEEIILRLERSSPIPSPSPLITTEIVTRAIDDTEILIQSSGAASGVDRIHTALHGYIKALCDEAGIDYDDNPTITRLFKLLRQNHTSFQDLGPRSYDIERILNSFANIMDALNPIRNQASLSHPSDLLLDKDEAMLVINTARTIIHYLDSKLSG